MMKLFRISIQKFRVHHHQSSMDFLVSKDFRNSLHAPEPSRTPKTPQPSHQKSYPFGVFGIRVSRAIECHLLPAQCHLLPAQASLARGPPWIFLVFSGIASIFILLFLLLDWSAFLDKLDKYLLRARAYSRILIGSYWHLLALRLASPL